MHRPESVNPVDMIPEGIDAALVVDESGTIRFATDHACHMLRYTPGELDGRSVELLVPKRLRLAHIGHRLCFTDDRRTRAMGAGLELFALRKDEVEIGVDISLSPVSRGLETLMIVTMRLRAANVRPGSQAGPGIP